MLLITCPVCGVEGEETEFAYGGEGHIRRPASHNPEAVSDLAQRDYLFIRKNPRGLHHERWLCARGCGKWFHAARDTMTMEFRGFYGITEKPSAAGRSKPAEAVSGKTGPAPAKAAARPAGKARK